MNKTCLDLRTLLRLMATTIIVVLLPTCGIHSAMLPMLIAQEKHALLVGVGEYLRPDKLSTLRFSEKDAIAIRELLESSGYRVTILVGPDATRVKILAALEDVAKQTKVGGPLILGFFGHGVQYESDAYFCPYDTDIRQVVNADGQKLWDGNKPLLEPDPQTMVHMREMLATMKKSDAGHKLLLADCCRENPNRPRGALKPRAFGSELKLEDLPRNSAAMFACSEDEQAFESDDWGHGAFTKAFLDACRSSEQITANELSVSVFNGVQSLVAPTGNRQTVNTLISGGVIQLGIVNKSVANDKNTTAHASRMDTANSQSNDTVATPQLSESGEIKTLIGYWKGETNGLPLTLEVKSHTDAYLTFRQSGVDTKLKCTIVLEREEVVIVGGKIIDGNRAGVGPATYKGKIDGRVLSGTWQRLDGLGGGQFSLTKSLDSGEKSSSTTSAPKMLNALNGLRQHEVVSFQKDWADHLGIEVKTTNKSGLSMVLIPPGEFRMGAARSDDRAEADEKPQHKVKISRPFLMASTEVTQGKWKELMGTEPWLGMGLIEGSNYPAAGVDWVDAREFCRRISEIEGVEYRLPTEAEWEFACRAGSTTRFSFGDPFEQVKPFGNIWAGLLYDPSLKIFRVTDSSHDEHIGAAPVGSFRSNSLGLHDMHGNVWEWCEDSVARYDSKEVIDPLINAENQKRVYRGGSWNYEVTHCRSSNRGYENAPGEQIPSSIPFWDVGFRPVCLIP
jgi:sulfatase modifying factor 1